MISTYPEHEEATVERVKQKRKQMDKGYMREYYHKHKTEVSCSYCLKTYSCNSGLVKHQARSLKCAYQQIKEICKDVNDPEDCLKHIGNIINK